MNISSFQFASCFELNKQVLFALGGNLIDLQKKLAGKLITLNVPDSAPPISPRALIISGDSLLNISFERFELTVKPPKHIVDNFDLSIDFALSRAKQIFPSIYNDKIKYAWSGVISQIAYPSKDKSDSLKNVTPLFDKLVNVQRGNRDLAAFNLQFGYNENGLFKNYTLTGYETRQMTIGNQLVQKNIVVDIRKIPLVETGIQITLDINNKVATTKFGYVDDLDLLAREAKKAFPTLLKDLNIEGLIA